MLDKADNERLVRVGPGTPMGSLMRLYWIPFLKSSDVTPDGQPYQVRILGEDLIAFRDSAGRVGLVDLACPHRGAPMIFGRNEAQGLRCVYHGWKFTVDGRCVEMPAERPDTPMLDRVRLKNSPVRERNGMLWAYLGPDAEPPALPDVEWNLVPPEHCHVSIRIQECNWLQALEGEIDSAHAAILHGRIDASGTITTTWTQAADLAPTFEVAASTAGLSIGSRRNIGPGRQYIRVNQFMMPFWTLVPPFPNFPDLSGHAWVPIDDEHTLCVMFSYHPSQPLFDKTRKLYANGHGGRESAHATDGSFEPRPPTVPYRTYWSVYNRANAYRFDYASQTTTYNSGLPGLWVQDAACQSGVWPIYDRSRENLGVSDTGVARTRRLLLEALRNLGEKGERPATAQEPTRFLVRAISIGVPEGGDWQRTGAEYMRAEPGKDLGYAP